MWDLPGPGIEPMSPALAGGFLTTVPPGKSAITFLRELKCISPDCFLEVTLGRIASVQEIKCSYFRYQVVHYLSTLVNQKFVIFKCEDNFLEWLAERFTIHVKK